MWITNNQSINSPISLDSGFIYTTNYSRFINSSINFNLPNFEFSNETIVQDTGAVLQIKRTVVSDISTTKENLKITEHQYFFHYLEIEKDTGVIWDHDFTSNNEIRYFGKLDNSNNFTEINKTQIFHESSFIRNSNPLDFEPKNCLCPTSSEGSPTSDNLDFPTDVVSKSSIDKKKVSSKTEFTDNSIFQSMISIYIGLIIFRAIIRKSTLMLLNKRR